MIYDNYITKDKKGTFGELGGPMAHLDPQLVSGLMWFVWTPI